MKNYSAKKLLTMAMAGQHMPYCQRTAFPVVDCLCLQHEVKAYQDRLAAKRSVQVPPDPDRAQAKKSTKTHFDFLANGVTKKVGCKNKRNVSTESNQVSCQHCLKAAKKLNLLTPVVIPSLVAIGVDYANLFPSNQ